MPKKKNKVEIDIEKTVETENDEKTNFEGNSSEKKPGKIKEKPLADEINNNEKIDADESASDEGIDTVEEKKDEALSEEEESFKIQLMRLKAEFQNYKKRSDKEKFELSAFVKAELMKRFMPVLDDMIRLKDNLDSEEKTLKDALKLVFPKIDKFFENEKISTIATIGDEFDPNLHEALMQQPVETDEEDDKIMSVFEQGYKLDERIIRFAKVQVGKKH